MDFVPQTGEVGSCSPFSDIVGAVQVLHKLWECSGVGKGLSRQCFTAVLAFTCEPASAGSTTVKLISVPEKLWREERGSAGLEEKLLCF